MSNLFFLIVASVADAVAVNPNGINTLLANGVITFFINGRPTFTNGARNLSNLPSCIIILAVVSFNKIPRFSKDLITFIISFISLFVSVIPEP